jgi:trimeric autotransporter adhesin
MLLLTGTIASSALILTPASAEEQPPVRLEDRKASNTHTSTAADLQAQASAEPAVITFGPRIGVGYQSSGSGYDGFGSFDGFIPLSQTPNKNLTYLQARLMLDNGAKVGGNILVGHRLFSPNGNRVFGGYLSYDNRDTGPSTFSQLGMGLEMLGDRFDLRLNGYLPVGQTRNRISESVFDGGFQATGAPAFSGNFLVIPGTRQQIVTRINEVALSGLDAEVGMRLLDFGNGGALRGYTGLYHYTGSGISTTGFRARLEANPTNGLKLGLGVQTDGLFGTSVIASVGLALPGFRPAGATPQSVLARMGDAPDRTSPIAVTTQREVQDIGSLPANIVLLNPATGQAWLFQHVNPGVGTGTGTFENPTGAIAPALGNTQSDGNSIVYVRSGTTALTAFTIPSQVQVLSTGPAQRINTAQFGSVQLPGSGAGTLPTVAGTVTLAANGTNQVLSGFAITNTPGQPGVTGVGNVSAQILQNTVTINAPNTATLQNGRGIVLNNASGNTQISTNTVRNAIGEGIRLDNVSGIASITNNTVLNTIQPQTQTGLESSIFIRNNTGDVDLTIANNLVGDNTTRASFDASGVPITSGGNEIDGIEVGICRAYTGADALARCSPTATARIAILNNTVRNIGVVGQDGADGIDINLNNGDDDNDTGARISSLTISGNQISNIADKGVSFGVDGDAVLTSGIVTNNTVDNVGDIGLALRTRLNSTTTFTVTGNTVSNAIGGGTNGGTGVGIEYALSRANNNGRSTGTIANNTLINNTTGLNIPVRGTGQASLTVSNNTITNTLTAGNTRGIDVQTQESGQLRLVLDTNAVSGSRADGIRIRSQNTSQSTIALRNNLLTGNNTTAAASTGGLSATASATSNLCLQLQRNTAGTTIPTGYFLSRTGTSTFRIEDIPNLSISNNVGTFTSNPAGFPAASFTDVAVGNCGL